MGDFAGFFAAVVAWFRAQKTGLDKRIAAAVSTALTEGKEQWQKVQFYYTCYLARKSVTLLLGAAAFTGLAVVIVAIVGWVMGGVQYALIPVVLTGCLWALNVAYGLYQIPSIPTIQEDAHGAPKHYGPHYKNNAGQWTDDEGRVLTYEEEVFKHTLPQGQTGTTLRLNNEGHALRYFRAGDMVYDAQEGGALVYSTTSTPIRVDIRGRVMRYAQINGGWMDARTGQVSGQAPANPEEVLRNQTVDFSVTLDQVDHRIKHAFAGLPMLNERGANKLERHSFIASLVLALTLVFTTGIAIIWMGVLNGETESVQVDTTVWTYTIGTRWIIVVGLICCALGLRLLATGATVLMASYAKGATILEFIASLAAEQGLVVLPGYTTENIKERFNGVNVVEQERHQAMVLKRFMNLEIGFMQWALPVAIIPNAWFAGVLAGFIAAIGVTDRLHERRGGDIEVDEDRYQTTKKMRKILPAIYVLFALIQAVDEWRLGFMAFLIQATLFVGRVVSGEARWDIASFHWWWIAALLIACTVLLLFITKEMNGWKAWVFKLLAGAVGLTILIAKISGATSIGFKRTHAAFVETAPEATAGITRAPPRLVIIDAEPEKKKKTAPQPTEKLAPTPPPAVSVKVVVKTPKTKKAKIPADWDAVKRVQALAEKRKREQGR